MQLLDHTLAILGSGPHLQFDRGMPDHLFPRIAKHGKVTVIDIDVAAFGQRGDAGTDRAGAKGRREALLALAQRLLGALALDELANLVADRGQYRNQLLVGRSDVLAEELDDAEEAVFASDRKGEGAVQARLGCRPQPGEV